MALDDRDGLGVAPGRDADVEGSRVDTRVDGVQARLRSPDRVLALSDGVFAIIVTILVLELKVPPSLSSESLPRALRGAPTHADCVGDQLLDRGHVLGCAS